jgi:hypothetical protein
LTRQINDEEQLQERRAQEGGAQERGAGVVRLQILLARDVADALKAMTVKNHTSLTEEVRRAITLLKWFYENVGDSREITVRDKSGTLKETRFLW